MDPWPENMQIVNGLNYGFYGEMGVKGTFTVKNKFYLGGSIKLLGYNIVSADPGGGPYFKMAGELSGGFKWRNYSGYDSCYWKAKASVETGVFFDAELKAMDDNWSWTLFNWELPVWKEEAAIGSEPEKTWILKSSPSQIFKQVAASSDGLVLVINDSGTCYKYNETTNTFDQFSTKTNIMQIAVAKMQNIWCVDKSYNIFRWHETDGWVQMPGSVDNTFGGVTVADDGTAWSWKGKGAPYRWSGSEWVLKHGSDVTWLSCQSDEKAMLITVARGLYHWNTTNWFKKSKDKIDVSGGGDGSIFTVGTNGTVYLLTQGGYTEIIGTMKQISCGDANKVWGINSLGSLFKYAVPEED